MSTDRTYHHGDLRAAVLRASFDLLAEHGRQRFSVAAVARSLGVSSAAPYRHFPDRDHLLSAVSATAAHDLNAEIVTAADAAGPDPAARLAAVSGTYVRYVIRTGAGFQVIFAADLYAVPDDARRDQTRALMTTLLDLATATGVPTYAQGVRMVEATIAVAHGYASLYTDGFYTQNPTTVDEIATRATDAALALINQSAQ